jgi:thiamine transport system substrate-binding protein
MTVSSPTGGPGRRSRRRSRRPAAAICNSWARATARRCCRGCGWKARGREADVVLGLDTNLTAAAAETGLFARTGSTRRLLTLPVAGTIRCSCPSTGAISPSSTTRRLQDVPGRFRGAGGLRRLHRDPGPAVVDAGAGPAAVGRGGLWRPGGRDLGGAGRQHRHRHPGWSEAYGLFLEGEADMVLSYTTSPAYHLIAEEDPTQGRRPFAEGHYMQIEVAGHAGSLGPAGAGARLPRVHADRRRSSR